MKTAISKLHGQAARQIARESLAEIRRGPDVNLSQQVLNIIAANSLRRELVRHDLAIEKRDCEQVR